MANGKKISLLEFFALEEGDALDALRSRRRVDAKKPKPQPEPPKDPEKDFFDRGDKMGEGIDEAEQLRAAHAEGDSKWSDPFAGEERMPHEEPHSEPQGKSVNAWKDQRPCQKLKDFFGGEPFPKHEGRVHEADDPKKPPVGSVTKGQAKKDLPADLPDDDEDDESFMDRFAQGVHDEEERMKAAAPPTEKEPWDDVTPDQIAKQTVAAPPPGVKQRDVWKLGQKVAPEAAPAAPEQLPPRAGIMPASEEDMTWDEFRAVEPESAGELERDTSLEEIQGGHFQKREDGRVYFISATGKRWGYLGRRYGWEEMDFDGETPDGGV